MNGPTIKQLSLILMVSIFLCIGIWIFALWKTGATVDYRADVDSGLVALRLAPDSGVSYQWSVNGYSLWYWTPARNVRLWSGYE